MKHFRPLIFICQGKGKKEYTRDGQPTITTTRYFLFDNVNFSVYSIAWCFGFDIAFSGWEWRLDWTGLWDGFTDMHERKEEGDQRST